MPTWKVVKMDKVELAPGIFVYSNVINNYQFLIEDIEESVLGQSVVWQQATVKTQEEVAGVYTDSRDTMTISVPYSSRDMDYSSPQNAFFKELSKIFFMSFNNIEVDYMSSHGIKFDNHSNWDILKYGIGQKFTNHVDDHPNYLRRISTVYYMNDNYSGGEINFPRFGISYKPKANEMIVFPSTYVYNHSVSSVTDGTRYAVVSWIY